MKIPAAYVRDIVLSSVSALLLATPALADNLQAHVYATSCLPGAAACNSSHGSGGLALESYAYGSAYGFNGGVVAARAGFDPTPDTLGGRFINNGTADLTYTFQIQGAPGTVVPLHVFGNANVSSILASTFDGSVLTNQNAGTPEGTTGFSIQSGVSIDVHGIRSIDAFGNTSYSAAHVDAGNNSDNYNLAGQSVSINQILYLQSNTDISVDIFAGASLRYDDDGGRSNIFGSVSAYADPTFTIDDPAFSDFKIVGVPNDPASAAVPESASWAMMIVGFGLIGSRLRRPSWRYLPSRNA